MTRGRDKSIALAALLACTALACSSCVYYVGGGGDRPRYERQVELAAPLAAGGSFAADTGDGSVTVHGVETSECSVRAKIVAHARTEERAQELAEEVEVRLEPSGDGLRVVTTGPHTMGNAWYSVSLDVQVPAETRLSLSTGDGSVHIANIAGNVDAKSGDGSIEVEAVKGNVKLHTTDGSVSGTRLEAGTVDVHTGDGSVTLREVRADSIAAQTGDGNIRCQGIAAERVDCHTSDGSIHIEYAQDGPKAPNVTATTSDGGITFTAPPGLSAVIDASTGDGSIHTNLPMAIEGRIGRSLTGTVGDGAGKIRLRTHNGSITIR